ncbi:MAG: 2-oxoglutarate dehydrogenase complex dihydrolipoyllysine-residue succinyltransferase [Syntrophobacteraceae bacterium]
MKIEVKVPEVGESVREALLAQWLRKDGELVRKDEILFVIETDKVTLEVSATADGVLKILVEEGKTVEVGTVVAVIDTAGAEKEAEDEAAKPPGPPPTDRGAGIEPPPAAPVEVKPSAPSPSPPSSPSPSPTPAPTPALPAEFPSPSAPAEAATGVKPIISSSVRSLAEEKGVDLSAVTPTGPGGRITEGDVLLFLEQGGGREAEKIAAPGPVPSTPASRLQAAPTEGHVPEGYVPEGTTSGGHVPAGPSAAGHVVRRPGALEGVAEGGTVRKPMSPLRQRIAARLLESRRNTAMLTTFNEIDMTRVQELRKRYGEDFRQKHGVRLGIMSFFVKASAAALGEMPVVNAYIDGNDIVYQNFRHIGVAIGAERGLIVPVIRNVDRLGFPDIERAVLDFVAKISENRIGLSDLEGGTFTITNGGVYGSLLSTPILNPPQSAILGMHKIEERPVALGGQVVVRPMMYVALSYDHRIVDGREAVTFLKRIKDLVENPERMMMEL